MGGTQMRVTFDFAGARDVRDLTAVPEVGEWVIHGDELWIVRSIDEADAGQVVICELPTPQRV